MSRIPLGVALLALALSGCAPAPAPEAGAPAVLPEGIGAEASTSTPDPALGRRIADRVCGRCHALEGEGPSPHPAAPPFPLLARRLPPETLQPLLEEGIRADHPDMPEVRLAPAEIDSFLAFWSSL